MDGRWKLVVAGGILAGAVGCNSMSKRPTDQAPPPALTPAQSAKVPPPPAEPQRTNLKPTTYVQMGMLTDQAADEPDRPQAQRDGLRSQARESYQKAIQIDPKFTPAYLALGKSYLTDDERDRAEAEFKKATALAPNDISLWSEIGNAQAQHKNWPAAIACFTRAVQLDPGNKTSQTRLGLTQARAGQYEESLNTLAKIMPEAEARFNVARMMKHNQQSAAASVQLQLALKADPTYEPARELLGEGRPADGGVQQAGYQQAAPRNNRLRRRPNRPPRPRPPRHGLPRSSSAVVRPNPRRLASPGRAVERTMIADDPKGPSASAGGPVHFHPSDCFPHAAISARPARLIQLRPSPVVDCNLALPSAGPSPVS